MDSLAGHEDGESGEGEASGWCALRVAGIGCAGLEREGLDSPLELRGGSCVQFLAGLLLPLLKCNFGDYVFEMAG